MTDPPGTKWSCIWKKRSLALKQKYWDNKLISRPGPIKCFCVPITRFWPKVHPKKRKITTKVHKSNISCVVLNHEHYNSNLLKSFSLFYVCFSLKLLYISRFEGAQINLVVFWGGTVDSKSLIKGAHFNHKKREIATFSWFATKASMSIKCAPQHVGRVGHFIGPGHSRPWTSRHEGYTSRSAPLALATHHSTAKPTGPSTVRPECISQKFWSCWKQSWILYSILCGCLGFPGWTICRRFLLHLKTLSVQPNEVKLKINPSITTLVWWVTNLFLSI